MNTRLLRTSPFSRFANMLGAIYQVYKKTLCATKKTRQGTLGLEKTRQVCPRLVKKGRRTQYNSGEMNWKVISSPGGMFSWTESLPLKTYLTAALRSSLPLLSHCDRLGCRRDLTISTKVIAPMQQSAVCLPIIPRTLL